MPRAIGCRSRAHGAQTIPRHVGPRVERGPIRGRGEPKTDPWPRGDGPVAGTRQFHPTAFGESLGVFLTLMHLGARSGPIISQMNDDAAAGAGVCGVYAVPPFG